MAGLTEIMDELGDTIRDALGPAVTTAYGDDLQVVPFRWFNPTPPAIDIYPADDFRATTAAGFGDISGELIFVVRARVAVADNEAGQKLLYALMDDEHDLCLADALLDDQTLNGLTSSVMVEGPTGGRIYDDTGTHAFFGCEWRVTVLNVST